MSLVLYIFNAYHADIKTPLEGLYKLLVYLEHFDWDEQALSLFGPIKVRETRATGGRWVCCVTACCV